MNATLQLDKLTIFIAENEGELKHFFFSQLFHLHRHLSPDLMQCSWSETQVLLGN